MADYNYDSLKAIVLANGGLGASGDSTTPPSNQPFSFTGTVTIDLGALQDEVLALKFDEETDQTFGLDITGNAGNDTKAIDSLKIDDQGFNEHNEGSAIIDSNRVMINASKDYAMLFGAEGVAIASPRKVNIDAGDSITLFGRNDMFLGLPAKGVVNSEAQGKLDLKKGKSVGDPTPSDYYEPLILGIKLINLIEDMIVTIQNSQIAGPTGNGVFQPSTIAEFELLKLRLPEVVSTYAFVDGLSAQEVDEERLKVVKAAAAAAVDFVPPRTLTGLVQGTGNFDPNSNVTPPPPNPVNSPYKDLPGFYETPTADPYGDANSL